MIHIPRHVRPAYGTDKYRTMCGRYLDANRLIDMRRQTVDEATCLACQRCDDAEQLRDARRAEKERRS